MSHPLQSKVDGFKESEERRVKLSEDDPEVFKVFAGLIYFVVVHSQGSQGNKPDQGQ